MCTIALGKATPCYNLHMPKHVSRWLKKLGPGFITGAADDDPSGIATYTQVGAQFGLAQLWTAAVTLPCMIAVQEMSARIGLAAGQGLGAIIRKNYPRWVMWSFITLLIIANTLNIGADMGAMSEAVQLLIPRAPFVVIALGFTALILILEILVTYKTYVTILKWFAFTLLGYLITAIIVTTDWISLLTHAVLPTIHLKREFMLGLVAVLGTTISPYLFIWQSHEEVEEKIALGRTTVAARKGIATNEIKAMRQDVILGMSFSNLIMFCIIATAAAVFFRHGITDIQTSAQAARALEPLAGRFATLLFTLGIIGTGLLTIPILSASASYMIADACGWSNGLYKKFRHAHGFYGVITLSTLIGLLINFIGIGSIKALIFVAILNGLITPPLLIVMLAIANNKQLMGRHVNGRLSNVLVSVTIVGMTLAGTLMFVL